MTEWRPIETAPEGVEVLVYAPLDGVVSSAYRYGNWQKLKTVSGCGINNDPTHWMVLPAPPEKPSNGWQEQIDSDKRTMQDWSEWMKRAREQQFIRRNEND